MLASKKFQDSFNKALKKNTESLLPPSDLQEAYNESFESQVSKERCKSVRENTVKYFTTAVNEEFKKLCGELGVEEKFLLKQNLVAEQKNELPTSGWRPSGDAEKDIFGDKRPTQINHINNLKRLDAELEEELKKSKKALEKEHKVLQAEFRSND